MKEDYFRELIRGLLTVSAHKEVQGADDRETACYPASFTVGGRACMCICAAACGHSILVKVRASLEGLGYLWVPGLHDLLCAEPPQESREMK